MNTVEPIRSKTQVLGIAAHLKAKNERDYVLFMFGVYSGLRISDILPLRVCDVRGKSKVYMREKKTGKEKTVFINKELQVVIADYIVDMPDWVHLFPSRQKTSKTTNEKDDRPITRQRVNQILKAAADYYNIDNVGSHTLRKTFGYHMYNDTKDIATIQALFNHSSPLVTLRYIGVDQDKKDSLVRDFSFTK